MSITTDGKMYNPPHPGEVLRDLYMDPMNISVTQLADALDVSRKHVSAIVNGRAPISTDFAVRLGLAFGTDADLWVNMQTQYDLWEASQQKQPKVKRLAA